MHKDEHFHTSLINNRSEEVAHIVDNMPSDFGRYVSLLVIILVSVMLIFGWLIKYPDVLKGKISINGRQAPIKLVANTAGRILFLTDSLKSVSAEQYIAVIKNAADPKDVQTLKQLLKGINIHNISYTKDRHYFPETLAMGELNAKYFAFLEALYQYLDYYHEKPIDQQEVILNKSLNSQKELLRETLQQYKKEQEKFSLSRNMYKRDSILYSSKVITKNELETSNVNVITKEQEYRLFNKEITTEQSQIDEVDGKIKQLSIQKLEKQNQLDIDLINNFNELEESIRQWEHKYVFISPIEGKIELLSFWKNNDFIQEGREIFSVIPEKDGMVGQVQLPEQGSGRVKIGQDVIIKLDNYPYAQYGSIRGKVRSMSMVANEQVLSNNEKTSNYLITISLPYGLKTNYGKNLTFHFEAKGLAEIITNDERIIERLFDNLRHDIR